VPVISHKFFNEVKITFCCCVPVFLYSISFYLKHSMRRLYSGRIHFINIVNDKHVTAVWEIKCERDDFWK
jgi:hypothetical protein